MKAVLRSEIQSRLRADAGIRPASCVTCPNRLNRPFDQTVALPKGGALGSASAAQK